MVDGIFPGRRGAILSEKHSYRAYRFEWTGAPRTPPDIAAERSESGGLTLYASWNGATEVANWQALSGASETALEPSGEPVPRAGFETELLVASDAAFVAVAALDADGAELGRSAAVQP